MKATLKIFTLTAVLLGFASISFAQSTDNATADAKATILTALEISVVHDLDFGTIASTNALQEAKIIAASGGDRTGAAYVGSTYSVGEFLIKGEKGQAVNFSVEAETKLTDTDGGTETMDITFTNSISGTSFTLNTNGQTTMYVGGTLKVAARQASGDYKGTYKVTVNYN